jgi:uncharacterized protein (DUF4415 family)
MRTVTEPLVKVTLNLYAKDVAWFKARFRYGYQEQIREAIRSYISNTNFMESLADD